MCPTRTPSIRNVSQLDLTPPPKKSAFTGRIGNLKLLTIVAGIVIAWLAWAKRPFSPYWIFAPVAIYALLAILHERTLRARARAEAAANFYRRGIVRVKWLRHTENRASASAIRSMCTRMISISWPRLPFRAAFHCAFAHGRKPPRRMAAATVFAPDPDSTSVTGSITELREKDSSMREDIAVRRRRLARPALNPEVADRLGGIRTGSWFRLASRAASRPSFLSVSILTLAALPILGRHQVDYCDPS